jgi:16S rRNA (cytidine1402-2'-O)-methyltransferase
MATLYIVPTPIGNLEDITLRALRILKEVRLIAAEDTRNSRKLLEHYGIQTPMTSYHEHNKLTKAEGIFEVLQNGGDVALISDAGTPGISDPGYELIQQAILAGITVTPLPGASATLTALSASGLPTDSFLFLGFPPRKYQALRDFLAELAPLRYTLIFYESPNRLEETLHAMLESWGNRQGVVGRELTKFYEELRRDTLQGLIDYYHESPPKGEVTLLIEGNTYAPDDWSKAEVIKAMRQLIGQGVKRGEAAKLIAEQSGWDRRDLYDLELS